MLSRQPALFDLQVNGFAGVDFQRADLSGAELRRAVAALRAHETERILLTLISDEGDALCRQFERLETMRRNDARIAETVCGYHLEGPFLSPESGYCGAHPPGRQRAPDLALFARLQSAAGGRIRLLTLAPEWPESAEFIAEVTRQCVVVALGHTNASEAQIDEAIRAGATLCTHLGNAVPQMLPRHENIVQRLLARDELTACFIPDGVHLPPHVLRNFFRAKPPGKVIFTTDAMAAAAAPPGRYTLGASEVESRDGAVRQPGGAHLAGSCLTADRGVANAARWIGVAESEARAMFSTRPAALFDSALPAVIRGRFDALEARQFSDRAALAGPTAALVAEKIGEAIATSGEARVVFACALSQDEFLAALTAQKIDWSKVIVFHMDEYVSLSATHPASFRRYLREHLLAHIAAPKVAHLIRADETPKTECQRYAALLVERPLDLVCMGIGENGHLAFNDPPVADFHDREIVKIVALDAVCRQQQVNDGCFATLEEVPTHALTLTIPALLGARAISCVVPGARKAEAVRATLFGPINTACPASILRTHPRAVLTIDDAAAALLPR